MDHSCPNQQPGFNGYALDLLSLAGHKARDHNQK